MTDLQENDSQENINNTDIKSAPSEGLAAYIVAYKVLGIGKDLALMCMEELAIRRKDGDGFEFESYIDQNIEKMPKPVSLDIKNMSSIMNIRNLSKFLNKDPK